MSPLDENWRPLGLIMRRVVSDLADRQRASFRSDCALEGVAIADMRPNWQNSSVEQSHAG